jgi:hypothetical protein
VSELSSAIATALNEPNLELVERVVEVIGPERATEFLQKALEVEAGGGMMITTGKRRRTPGGVFFYLVRKNISGDERRQIFPKPERSGQPSQPVPTPQPPLTWQEVRAIAVKLLTMPKGETTVKMTIIGRPKQVGKQRGSVFCIMEGRPAPSALPKGLPVPPEGIKQNIVVFIAEKQWRRVEDSLKANSDDSMIVEGWPYFDPARQMTVLLALSTTTKYLQRAKRQSAADGEQKD